MPIHVKHCIEITSIKFCMSSNSCLIFGKNLMTLPLTPSIFSAFFWSKLVVKSDLTLPTVKNMITDLMPSTKIILYISCPILVSQHSCPVHDKHSSEYSAFKNLCVQNNFRPTNRNFQNLPKKRARNYWFLAENFTQNDRIEIVGHKLLNPL